MLQVVCARVNGYQYPSDIHTYIVTNNVYVIMNCVNHPIIQSIFTSNHCPLWGTTRVFIWRDGKNVEYIYIYILGVGLVVGFTPRRKKK